MSSYGNILQGNYIENNSVVQKNTLSYTFTVPALNLYNQNYITNVSLYGLKGLQQSSVTELTLYQPLKDTPEYGNCPPQIGNHCKAP